MLSQTSDVLAYCVCFTYNVLLVTMLLLLLLLWSSLLLGLLQPQVLEIERVGVVDGGI